MIIFSILLLVAFLYLSYRIAPRERTEDAHIHGAGQVGLLAAIALFGVDYFTSYYYATGELMSALHPYGLQKYAYIAVAVIALANIVFGLLYMYSLGIFNEGGGSIYGRHALSGAIPQPDCLRRSDPRLCTDDRSIHALGLRSAALDHGRL